MIFALLPIQYVFTGYCSTQVQYFLQDIILESTASEKELGVINANNLKFSNQYTEMMKKGKRLYVTLSGRLAIKKKEIMFNLNDCLVFSHLEYTG